MEIKSLAPLRHGEVTGAHAGGEASGSRLVNEWRSEVNDGGPSYARSQAFRTASTPKARSSRRTVKWARAVSW